MTPMTLSSIRAALRSGEEGAAESPRHALQHTGGRCLSQRPAAALSTGDRDSSPNVMTPRMRAGGTSRGQYHSPFLERRSHRRAGAEARPAPERARGTPGRAGAEAAAGPAPKGKVSAGPSRHLQARPRAANMAADVADPSAETTVGAGAVCPRAEVAPARARVRGPSGSAKPKRY
jgi:hypothetical protein